MKKIIPFVLAAVLSLSLLPCNSTIHGVRDGIDTMAGNPKFVSSIDGDQAPSMDPVIMMLASVASEQTHTHVASTTWSRNAATHWKNCTYTACGYQFSSGSHSYGTGTSCTSGCGQTHAHSYSTSWSYDAYNHWKPCTVSGCSSKSSEGSHSFVGTSTVCKTCGRNTGIVINGGEDDLV